MHQQSITTTVSAGGFCNNPHPMGNTEMTSKAETYCLRAYFCIRCIGNLPLFRGLNINDAVNLRVPIQPGSTSLPPTVDHSDSHMDLQSHVQHVFLSVQTPYPNFVPRLAWQISLMQRRSIEQSL